MELGNFFPGTLTLTPAFLQLSFYFSLQQFLFMGSVYNIAKSILNAIPAIMEKIGSVMLFIFGLGAIFGYLIAAYNKPALFLLAPFASILVMWHDLDEGFLLFIFLLLLAIFL